MILCISLLLDSGCGVVVLDLCKDFVDFCIRIYVVHKRKLLHMINFEKESFFQMSVYFSFHNEQASKNMFDISEILPRI